MFRNLFRNLPPVTKNLLIINVLVWLLMEFVPSLSMDIERYCSLYYWESTDFGVWQLFTYMFIHGGFSHLFFNMFALLMFGGIIERSLGSARFLFYYISCGIGAALIQEGVFALMAMRYHEIFTPDQVYTIIDQASYLAHGGYFTNPIFHDPAAQNFVWLLQVPTVGASGAIFGILLAFGLLYPNLPMYIMFIPVPVKAKWVVIGYGVIELLMGIWNVDSSVAHFAHLGGMFFGLLMILYWKKKGTIGNGFGGY